MLAHLDRRAANIDNSLQSGAARVGRIDRSGLGSTGFGVVGPTHVHLLRGLSMSSGRAGQHPLRLLADHASVGPGSQPTSWLHRSALLINFQVNGPLASVYPCRSV